MAFGRFGKNKVDLKDVRLIPSGQCSMDGMALEDATRRATGLGPYWELHDVETLANHLVEMGLTVVIFTHPQGWCCSIARGDMTPDGDYVREYGEHRPGYALARAALVAMREYGYAT